MMFTTTRLLLRAAQTIREQNQAMARLILDCQATELAYMRISRDLIEQFLIALDRPEDQDVYRKRLSTSLGFYRDEIAVREEQHG